MTGDSRSLLAFLAAPVIVGDPDGRVVYVNPAFENAFDVSDDGARGEPLSALFEGGGREAMLLAVADVCQRGERVAFRMRQGNGAFLAQAAPIEAATDRVGVIVLLTPEPEMAERATTLKRELEAPLEDLGGCLEELLDQTGGRRDERYRHSIEQGLRALERAKKWVRELEAALKGSESSGGHGGHGDHVDSARVLREVAADLTAECEERGVAIHLLAPPELPGVVADGARLEALLLRLLRERVARADAGTGYTLSGRLAGSGADARLVIALVDPPDASHPLDAEPSSLALPELEKAVQAIGGELQVTVDGALGRCTHFHFRPA
ncbi:MAG: PAS domain-containing protein [Proteobacteria bacterium]|nr:PAS domain-containing protein [Pseudomonadota bacterium]